MAPYLCKGYESDNNTESAHACHSLSSVNVRGVSKQNVMRAVSQPSSCYSRATTVDEPHAQKLKDTYGCSDPSSAQGEPHSSGTLVNREMSSNHCHTPWLRTLTCTHKKFKTRGTQHGLEYYPSSPHKESVCLGSLTGRVQIFTRQH